MRTVVSIVGSVVFAAICVTPAVAQAAASPQQFLELWGKAWDGHDVDAMVRLHAEDCVAVNRFGVVASGKDEIRRGLQWLHTGPFRMAHFGVPRMIDQRRIAPGIVTLHASWRSPSGRAEPAYDEIVLTLVLKDFPGEGWVAEEVDINAVQPLAVDAFEAPEQL